ncbi:hypothetical protein F4679DRAFT_262427 [Xylaria curta]|nr:hypothetical protein F4679DRAFT_262427 [Xylaria curta]
MSQATGRATLQSPITDFNRQEVRTYEAECREFNTFRQKALNGIGVRLRYLNDHAANIDAMLASRSDNGSGEISRLRRRANEAKKTTMPSMTYRVTDEDIIRLRVERKNPGLKRGRMKTRLTPTQDSPGGIPTKKPPQRQTINRFLKNKESPTRIQAPVELFDVKSDEVMIASNRNNGKDQPSAAEYPQLKRQRTEVETIHIQDVQNAFIFEYPYNTSLLWILRCSPCNFEAKRNPLTAMSNVISHWNSRHRQGITILEILENHLVQVVGGSIDEARKKNIEIGAIGERGCQPRRDDAPRYKIPEFITPLLPCNKRQELANSTPHNELVERQLEIRPDPVVQEFWAANEVLTPLPPRPRQTLSQMAYGPSVKPKVEDDFATILRKRPLHPPSLAVPSSESLVNSLNSNSPTLVSPSAVLFFHPPPSKIVDPPQVDSTWRYRNAVHQTHRLTPAYENGRDTAEYIGLNTG